MLGNQAVIRIATEFIKNENKNISKNDCEQNVFKRLVKKLKRDFQRLSICILGDSLYAIELVFNLCKNNKWVYLIRYKDGGIPSIAEGCIVFEEKEYKRKKRKNLNYHIKWLSDLPYKNMKEQRWN